MSFRNRLALFFVVIVIIPMIAIAVVLLRLLAEGESGKADASLASLAATASTVYRQEAAAQTNSALVAQVSGDGQLALALSNGDRTAAQRRAQQLASANGLQRLQISRGGALFVDVGSTSALAPVGRELLGSSGSPLGELTVSTLDASRFANDVRTLTGLHVVVHSGPTLLASTLPAATARNALAAADHPVALRAGGRSYRAVAFDTPGFGGNPVRVALLFDETSLRAGAHRDEVLAIVLLAALSLLAALLALGISRSLQAELSGFLAAARRVAGGDFRSKVPVHGHDEFAALGEEFNKMSDELQERMDELGEQRRLLEGTLRRVGETFASSLDRDALLEIVLRTVVEGVHADGGRAFVISGGSREQAPAASIGDCSAVRALTEVEAAARHSGHGEQLELDGVSALGHPIGSGAAPLGVISVSRADRPFEASEREMFAYLARQAAVSIDNVDLHERIKEQAITDELTGLFNRRRLETFLADELRRGTRFDRPVGVVMLDLDDFKQINDYHGHPQGDLVLVRVGEAVRLCSRDIDCPARYGGEELAVVLPETDISGALRFAERLRQAIGELRIERLDHRGPPLRITASVGAAAAPGSGDTADELIAAADAALYRAKRAGKNRVYAQQA